MLDVTAPAEPVVVRPPELRTAGLVVALALGVAADLGVRGDPANLVLAVALGGTIVLLLASRATRRTSARLLLVAALVPVAMLAVRASPWLTVSNLALAFALVGSALLFGRQGTILDATPATWLRRLGPAGRAVVHVGDDAVTARRDTSGRHAPRLGRVVRAVALALPFLVVALVLLAHADVVFADLVAPDLDAGAGIGHAVVAVGAAVAVIAAWGIASRIDAHDVRRTGTFGALEAATMLGLVAAVLGAFVVAQLLALTGAGERLVREAGLTPAQYARSGFFELCWATLVITVLLAVIRRVCAPGTFDRPALRCLYAAVPALTIGLVVVSLRRMAYYDSAFGLTMLRVWAVGGAIAIGLVLVALSVRNARFPAANPIGAVALLVAFVLVAGADVANPEAFVVRHNVARSRAGATIDLGYLGTLSADAIPQIAASFRGRPALVRHLAGCGTPQGVGRLNLAEDRAVSIRDRVCGRRAGPVVG